MKKTKILVTGAAGTLGANLIEKLSQDPKNEINALIFPGMNHPFLKGLDLNIFYGDIRKKEDVKKAMKGCSYVYQIAGVVSYNKIDNKKVLNTHANGIKNVLEVAKELKVRKVVVTASTAGIGIPENENFPLKEESPFDFKKYKKVAYMYSKHLTIEISKQFAKDGLDVSIISPTTIYGKGDVSMHIGKVVKKIKQGKIRYAPPGGNAVVSVSDVVDAHILVMEKGKSGENYIVANECLSYIDMFNRIAKKVGAEEIKAIMPKAALPPTKLTLSLLENIMLIFGKRPIVSPTAASFRFKSRYFDSTKIRKELGWRPRVSFEKAIEEAIQFYEKMNLL